MVVVVMVVYIVQYTHTHTHTFKHTHTQEPLTVDQPTTLTDLLLHHASNLRDALIKETKASGGGAANGGAANKHSGGGAANKHTTSKHAGTQVNTKVNTKEKHGAGVEGHVDNIDKHVDHDNLEQQGHTGPHDVHNDVHNDLHHDIHNEDVDDDQDGVPSSSSSSLEKPQPVLVAETCRDFHASCAKWARSVCQCVMLSSMSLPHVVEYVIVLCNHML